MQLSSADFPTSHLLHPLEVPLPLLGRDGDVVHRFPVEVSHLKKAQTNKNERGRVERHLLIGHYKPRRFDERTKYEKATTASHSTEQMGFNSKPLFRRLGRDEPLKRCGAVVDYPPPLPPRTAATRAKTRRRH